MKIENETIFLEKSNINFRKKRIKVIWQKNRAFNFGVLQAMTQDN